MLLVRIGVAFVGSLLVVFSTVRIVWEFVRWAVQTMSDSSPAFVGTDPRITWRVEAVVWAVGVTMILAGMRL